MMQCKHFDICGGCKTQDISYQNQLNLKVDRINNLMAKYGFKAAIKPINHFNQWFYRNKMEFTFSCNGGGLVCGLHSKNNKREVFDLEECLIFSKDTPLLLSTIRDFAKKMGYLAYNKFSHLGFLRHLIVRETKFTDEIMIGIVTTSQDSLATENLVNLLKTLSLKKKIKSVYWIINDSFGDAVTFEQKNLIYGDNFITENLGNFTFKIYIDSFFQTNPLGIAILYDKLASYAPLNKTHKALDLYCGAGSISLFLSSKADFVWGVEVSGAAIDNATGNAQQNNVKNTSFICNDVRKFLAQGTLINKIELVVVNPPRCGLAKKVKKRVMELKAPFVFYSSCNPNTFFEDLGDLSLNYNIEFIEPFDFFPHTPHMEVFAFLSRIKKG